MAIVTGVQIVTSILKVSSVDGVFSFVIFLWIMVLAARAGLSWNRHAFCKERNDAARTQREEDTCHGVIEGGRVW